MSILARLWLKQCVLLLAMLSILQESSSSMELEMQVERKLKLLNKPALKSIQSEDGDIIDCVDIHKQPAFDHPLLKNHTIQMMPTKMPFDIEEETNSSSNAQSLLMSSQLWQKSGSCPQGTIPIRRVQRHHLIKAPSVKSYGKKNAGKIEKYELRLANRTFGLGIEALHTTAVLIAAGYSYTGARANFNVWNPSVEADDESSSSHISLRNGPYDNSDAIEFGWTVHPSVYGDRRTRLFIYWTKDSGRSTGCFDLLCSGFVQINHEIALGAVIEPISRRDGKQYYIDLYVWKDFETDTGNWWLVFRNTTTIGYWPSSIFKFMYVSTMVLFGGDVYSPRMYDKPHTTTQMGSGRWATAHWRNAAFIQRPRIRDYSLTLKYPDPPNIVSLQRDCYSAQNYAEELFTEPLFYFGGPGRNTYCP